MIIEEHIIDTAFFNSMTFQWHGTKKVISHAYDWDYFLSVIDRQR